MPLIPHSLEGNFLWCLSLHPDCQQFASINSAIDRLLNIPMSHEAHETETRTMEFIASINSLKIYERTLKGRKKLHRVLSETAPLVSHLPLHQQH